MNTELHLSNLGVTMAQCRSFIAANMDKPANIFNAAKQHNIDSQMLAEIVADQFPGVKAEQVEAFFSSHGLNGKDLNAAVLNPSAVVQSWKGDSPIKSLFDMNNNKGILATEFLRFDVLSKVDMNKYINTFSPQHLPGAADGVLSVADLGFSQIGDIAATWQNIESLYYGTMINLLRNITFSKTVQINDFGLKHQTSLAQQDPKILSQLQTLMLDVLLDPPTVFDRSALSDIEISQSIKTGLVTAVQLVGIEPNQNLFIVFE